MPYSAIVAIGGSLVVAVFGIAALRGMRRVVVVACALIAFAGSLRLQMNNQAQLDRIAESARVSSVRSAPRQLSKEQKEFLLASLQPFAGTIVGLSTPENNTEIARYAEDFAAVLEGAQWQVGRTITAVEAGESGLGLSLAYPDGNRAGEALARALWQGGIRFARVNWRIDPPPTVGLRISARLE